MYVGMKKILLIFLRQLWLNNWRLLFAILEFNAVNCSFHLHGVWFIFLVVQFSSHMTLVNLVFCNSQDVYL